MTAHQREQRSAGSVVKHGNMRRAMLLREIAVTVSFLAAATATQARYECCALEVE